MPEDEKNLSPEFTKIDPKLMELFLGLEEKVGPDEKHEVQEILGELKIGHKEEARKLLRYLKFKKQTKKEGMKSLNDDLKEVEDEIITMKNILSKPEYEKEYDVYKEQLEKYEKRRDELLEKIKQTEAVVADLTSIEEIEQKLEETE